VSGSASHFTAGAIGEPGQRTFYLYVVVDGTPRWFLAEKQQVAALGAQSLEALPNTGLAIDEEVVAAITQQGMDVPWPSGSGDVAFRVASMALRLNSDEETLTVVLSGTEEETFEFDVTAHQMQAMALVAVAASRSGRPICPKCQLPEDPEGHDCPSSNGHKPLG
jgi:uncharacterized repeat protein (TIGR03847 family)